MCGLFGVYDNNRNLETDLLSKGIGALRHRGPDGTGVYLSQDKRAGLAHARLAIMDPKSGAQPLFNEDNTIAAVVNGEFYDFEPIRNELRRLGHSFKTDSDSEILLHLYEEFGLDCLSRLRGEFAFLLWDSAKETLFAARDRFGIKPLLYTSHGSKLLFASEAKAFFAAGLKPDWNYSSLFQMLSLHYRPAGATLFEGISQLRPGHYLTVQNSKMIEDTYWDLGFAKYPAGSDLSEEQWSNLFKENLFESIRTRMRSDVPVAFYLSGGLDSAAAAALAVKAAQREYESFTVSFSEKDYDEGPIAARMAASLGIKAHTVKIAHSDILAALSDSVYFSEGLAINGHLPAKFLLSRAVHEAGIKVVLTGEGADELLAGYPHFQVDFAPDGVHKESLDRSHHASRGIMLSSGETLPTSLLKEKLGFVPEFLAAKGGFGNRMRPFLSNEFIQAFDGCDPYKTALEGLTDKEQFLGRSPLRVSMYLWNKLALTNYILHPLGDGTEMAHSVEGRLPFLDHKLFEKTRALPEHLLIKNGSGKALLRSLAKDLVTPEILARNKHPFFSPPLLGTTSEEALADITSTIKAAALPFLDKGSFLGEVRRIAGGQEREKKLFDPLLFTVLSLCHFEKRFGL